MNPEEARTILHNIHSQAGHAQRELGKINVQYEMSSELREAIAAIQRAVDMTRTRCFRARYRLDREEDKKNDQTH